MATAAPAKAAPKAGKPRAPGRLPLQKKMTVGAAGDRMEQEADRIAQRVGKSGEPASAPPPVISSMAGVQRKPSPARGGPEKRKDEPDRAPEKRAVRMAQRAKAAPAEPVGLEGGDVPEAVEKKIDEMRTRSASGLDPQLRDTVESAVGRDLSAARVHTGPDAAQAADSLGAKAFTVGQDMFFGQGEFKPETTAGKQLIAHEAAHTVQQTGGSAQAKRIVRREAKKGKKADKGKKKKEIDPSKPVVSSKELKGDGWSISTEKVEAAPKGGTIHVPKLELPEIVGKLKGSENPLIGPASASGVLPESGKAFTRNPQEPRADREDGAAFEKWVDFMRANASKDVAIKLKDQIEGQKGAAGITTTGNEEKVYVLKRKNLTSKSLDVLLVGTIKELSEHDGVLRPMISKAGKGGAAEEYDADHILEDQLGGLDSATNMWLLDRSYNRSVGSQIKARIDDQINSTLDKARAQEEEDLGNNIKFEGKVPTDVQAVKRTWQIVFDTVSEGNFGQEAKNYWSRDDIKKGAQLKHFSALSEKELVEQGFIFKDGQKPARINVFPNKDGGRAMAFTVAADGKSLKPPGYFFRGITVTGAPAYDADALKENDKVLIKLPVAYTKKKGGKGKDKDSLIQATGDVLVKHDKRLGFGGYVTRDSITGMFKDSDFSKLSPMSFPDVSINADGDLTATGQIKASKAFLSGAQIPISLLGDDIFLSFPVPTDKLNFGPVKVTEAALDLGVGESGFFMAGSASVVVDQVGSGTLSARVEKDDVIIAGDFNLDMDFLNPAMIAASYSLAKDDFEATVTLGVQKDALPGVDSGSVTVSLTRNSVGVTGTLALGGLLKGAVLTVGYTPETGLMIEGKDIPVPVSKLPGVSDAAVTVKAVRSPETGLWSVSGGGKAKLSAGGASGSLDILYDGIATSFVGRVDVAKGPATGWIEIRGTNRAIDDKGNPIEGGPVGDLKIWGKGEAGITFGKVLTGKAGIEYTPDGRVIVSGEIAMPPTYDLFPKKDLSPKKPLLDIEPPSFPIWGVSLGPVDIGILAFVKAKLAAEAWVGPGQLKDAKVKATMDLDKPDEAVVDGGATFFVPSYAGFDLYLGGGLKASAAIAYVRGDVGLYGKLGLGVDGSFDVSVHWSKADGLAVGANAKLEAKPKFEVGIRASVTAGVSLPWPLPDLDHTWGPWEEPLGSFGPDMALTATFPMKWSEKDGLDINPENVTIDPPKLDPVAMMESGFDALV